MEIIIWFFAIYGFVALFYTIWEELKRKRKWTFVIYVKDPDKAEGELRSLLLDLPAKKFYPARLILIWQNNHYNLAQKLKEEFPGIEVVERVEDVSLKEIIQNESPHRTVCINGSLDS
ncbi:hypothetical protein [Natranaerofaba carboxydovora]|uniref:hypothetical protein n=1 Tax=Natranaerofaba carboxydovora TaxID=2742683 RepID=UPI001F137A93|nr:hypothetical protein [Natranaerofaba carboxydovora]UMZ75042.1 hypothetical protein ACONDI_02653 [Natranaerofaba carboxydovora]